MLALLVALSVSQAPVVDSPPPLPSPEPSVMAQSSARLVTEGQPRVGVGILAARMGMTTLLGGVGGGLGALGLVLATAASPLLGLLVSPLAVGLGVLGVAAGAALFGDDFRRDFIDALKVSGIAVPVGVALVMVSALLPALSVFIVPLVAVGLISTPLIVQVRKPMPSRVAPRETRETRETPVVSEGGVTFQL